MTTRTRKIAFSTMLLTLFLIPAESILSDVLDGRTQCQRVAGWVELHAASLPESLDELEAYPMAYRRAIFAVLSAERKAAVFSAHLSRHLASEVDPTKRALILNAQRLFTTDLYVRPGETRSAVSEFTEEVKRVFGETEARRIFASVGETGVRRVGGGAAARVVVAEFLRAKFTAGAEAHGLAADCQCSTESDWCDSGGTCHTTLPSCDDGDSSWGCGTALMYRCNGQCFNRNR